MKFISWNVNGLRSSFKKGFEAFYRSDDFDILCLQEIKMEKGQLDFDFTLNGKYFEYWNSAIKKGYSGVAIFSKIKPLSVNYGMNIEHHDQEGRIITLEFSDFYFINIYTPNSKRELLRLDYRMQWENDFRKYILKLDEIKPVIICGDLNVAHQEIDIKNAKSNTLTAGFTIEERNKMTELLKSGFIDTYRHFYPDTIAYTWWSMMPGVRERNIGWRLDYFLVSDRFINKVQDSLIYKDIYGSDHCPVGLEVKI